MRPYNKPNHLLRISALLSIILLLFSCKKLVDVKSSFTSVNSQNVYDDDNTAISAVTGLYTLMSAGGTFTGASSINLLAGLSSDELTLYSGVTDTKLIGYYTNALISNAAVNIGTDYWAPVYGYIYDCNLAIEGLSGSTKLSLNVKQQLLGEVKFLRSFFYFHLVNMYGDVPLILTSDYKGNSSLGRTAVSQIYQQIIADLKESEGLLSADFLNEKMLKYSVAPERVRPTKWAASALLSKAYLYSGDYANSEAEATLVINSSSLFSLTPLLSTFLKNSNEAIWQLQPVTSGQNTQDAVAFVLAPSGPVSNGTKPVYLSNQLLSSFEAGDKRRVNGNWVNSVTVSGVTYYYPYKYQNISSSVTEYLMMFRLGEIYLIRGEARAQLGNISGSQSDLNAIRTRAGLPNTTATDKGSLLISIIHERQDELFTEDANRWFDLKRTGSVDATMSVVKPLKANGIAWKTTDQLYPILYADILKNLNLTQNSGY